MALISGTAFSAMGIPKFLYDVIFMWCQNMSWRLYFFRYFKTLRLQVDNNTFWFKNFKLSTFLIEKYRVIPSIN